VVGFYQDIFMDLSPRFQHGHVRRYALDSAFRPAGVLKSPAGQGCVARAGGRECRVGENIHDPIAGL